MAVIITQDINAHSHINAMEYMHELMTSIISKAVKLPLNGEPVSPDTISRICICRQNEASGGQTFQF